MAFVLPQMPNFQTNIPQMPNPVDQMAKIAQLKNFLSENSLRQSLAPGQIQQQQQQLQSSAQDIQLKQLELESQQGVIKAFADPAFTKKFTGTPEAEASGLGFDPNAMMNSLFQDYGVKSPQVAQGIVDHFLKRSQTMAEIAKTTAQGGEAEATIRTKGFDLLHDRVAGVLEDPKAIPQLLRDLTNNPKMFSGVPQDDLAHVYSALATGDMDTFKAAAGGLDVDKKIADFHKSKAEAAAVEGKTDPNSPFYDPSAAYLAKRAAAGDPEAKSILAQQSQQAGKKAGAEAAARLPYELQLKNQELAQNPVFAVNPKTGQRELTTVADAKAQGYTNPTNVKQSDIEKETALTSQVNDMQLNQSRYRASLNAMSDLSAADRTAMTHILSDPSVNNILLQGAGFPSVISMAEQSGKGRDWNSLSPDKQDALIGYLRMKNTALLAQKVLTGMGRASKEAMDIELANMPSPIEGATLGNKKLDAWQQNIDQMSSRTVKLPWMEGPQDVRARIEGQATQQYNQTQAGKQQGKYRPASGWTPKEGENVQLRGTFGNSRVRKVYADGSFDAEP